MSNLKLILAPFLLLLGGQTVAQTLIITETENGKNAALSLTQVDPSKMTVCLTKSPNHMLSCYEAAGTPLHLTDQNFTQYLAKKYEIDLTKDRLPGSPPKAN